MILKTGDCPALSSVPTEIRDSALARRRAMFSECGVYRYALTIQEPRGFGVAAFVMLNPSTADEMKDDPTVRRCRGFVVRWGFRELRVVNLFALRSTDPEGLRQHRAPIGPDNDEAIVEAAYRAERIVVAWGVHGDYLGRAAAVARLLERFSMKCLGRTKAGAPRHPLYLSSSAALQAWEPTRRAL